MKDKTAYQIELDNIKFELQVLKDLIEDYFDMPKYSMLWRDFYREYKKMAKLK